MSAGRTAAGLALLLGVAACSKSPGKPWIDKLEVDAFEGGEVASLSKEQLEQRLIVKLEAAKFVVAKAGQKIPEDVKPWRLQLAAGLSEPDVERQTSAVVLALELQHTGQSEPFAIDSRAVVKAPEGNDVEAMQATIRDSLDEALGRAVRQAAALIALENVADPQLVEKLRDPDAAVADAAVRVLVRHHHKAALPALLERLKSDDLDTLRGVIGLLVELRAPESVNPLVEAANQRGNTFQREVVFAVGSIGGDDAEAYLDLVASGHEDPLIRASAAQALLETPSEEIPATPWRKTMNRLLALLCVFSFAACTTTATAIAPTKPEITAGAFYPLSLGVTWSYEVKLLGETRMIDVTTLRKNGDGFVEDSTGAQFLVDGFGVRDQKRYLLRNPIAAGTKWTNVVSVSSVEVYEIIAANQPCDAPAGKWDGCVVVESRNRVEEGTTLVNEMTFAPGVGIVRLSTVLESNGKQIPQSTLALVKFKPPEG